mmetsp:Transcript_30034/g.77819  ORF Transcript_30034/g.77819 Transcript_30034/m.77819 type:complete len:688 (+) Transcript_30034:41-2104(+)|eukprot:CAMPEP_0115841350 /NCGR_PEP_ID=MMETSP0287-20121206/7243_1 /TAXON_ID=412157 /ORGANISM="Chrysochromulina rotalis, Strain UIO044" /LENGTH=687 /DNA_ID=CAMNT_0003294993 /DNA_START=1 /DNA_END=2064 /DNA_ORIENTATION=-
MSSVFSHQFVPDDEGLFCLFCGRTAGEHAAGTGGGKIDDRSFALERPLTGGFNASVDEEDDWDAVQDELKRLTRRCQQESESRERAEALLGEMKTAFAKLREDVGVIHTWGQNSDGQLGHYADAKQSPVEIRGVMRQISCGGAHTAALSDDGQLYLWGRGNEGQLGLGDYRPRTVPSLMKALGDQMAGTTVLQVACGSAHTVALCDNGDVYTWGSNDEMQLGLGSTFGRKVNRPELVAELGNKGVLRVAAGKNFSMALTESGDVYSWGAGGALQLGHGSKVNEEVPRMIETLREVRKLGGGSSAEHAAAIVIDHGLGDAEEEGQADDLHEAEDQLDKARSRREDAMRAMRADIEGLQSQISKLDAKLVGIENRDSALARLHALRESIKGEVAELEIIITAKSQLSESMALLNKHKTNDFRTAMLMKWSRNGKGDGGDGEVVPGGGFSPRTMTRKQSELKQMHSDQQMLQRELCDVDEQLDQIELEKARLEAAGDEDVDITEALDELREQLSQAKNQKLSQMQILERSGRDLASELGVSGELLAVDAGVGGRRSSPATEERMGSEDARAGNIGLSSRTSDFARIVGGLWKKLEASAIEKINVGQQEVLGVRDLLKLSNAAIESVSIEVKRAAASGSGSDSEVSSLLYDLMVDSCSARKRLNDYTEGLLSQTSQRLDLYKAQAGAQKRQ